jgi:hypothetical protein
VQDTYHYSPQVKKPYKKEKPCNVGLFFTYYYVENGNNNGFELDSLDNIREDFANRRSEQGEDDDNDYGDQNEDQRIFNQTLTFFFGSK